jgi:hypothetical protein
MSYSEGGYSMAMPQMTHGGPNAFADSLPSIANHQTSARSSRTNSVNNRPGSAIEENRRLSGLDFQDRVVSFNEFRPDIANQYAAQQNQNASIGPSAGNHYNYEHPAASNGGMPQNGLPIKTEGSDPTTYSGVPSLPNVEGMSGGQDVWRNGTFNGDSHLMTSSTAGGPFQPKASGVLTGTF